MFRRLGKRAQTTAEYAVLIAIVVGAVVAMQVYVRRGLQGRIRNVVDDIDLGGLVSDTNASAIFAGEQYEPYYIDSTANTQQLAGETENLLIDGNIARGSTTNVTANRDQTMGWSGY